MTHIFVQTPQLDVKQGAINGGIAGIGGGLIFGLMMGWMGMLPLVAQLIGQSNAIVGFIVHLVISAVLGAIFGIIAIRLESVPWTMFGFGLLYGFVWWVLGALILMPLLLGMSQMVLAIGQPQLMSLLGHLLYGLIAAAIFIRLNRS